MRLPGRTVFLLFVLALAGVLLATAGQLPPVVASHFDGAGRPNGWSSRSGYVVLILSIGILLPLGIVGLVRGVSRGGPGRLNIPAREYWTSPEHRDEAVRRVRAYMWWLGVVLAGTALLMHAVVLAAHTSEPPRLRTEMFLLVFGAALSGIAGWTVGWYRLLRNPEETKRPAGAMAPPGRKSEQD
jgi:serine/threonine-protein kinase